MQILKGQGGRCCKTYDKDRCSGGVAKRSKRSYDKDVKKGMEAAFLLYFYIQIFYILVC